MIASALALFVNVQAYGSIETLNNKPFVVSSVAFIANIILYGITVETKGEWNLSGKTMQRPVVVAQPVSWPLVICFFIWCVNLVVCLL